MAELCELLKDKHPTCNLLACQCDVTNEAQLQSVAEQIQQQFGALDLVVNAVGKSDRGTVLSLSPTVLQELWRINAVSSLNVIQKFRPGLRTPGSCCVLIGSLASLFAPRFLGGYALAKHAVAALAQQARLELAEDGVHVLLACPGPIQRQDSGTRYASVQDTDLPPEALQPGGGAQLKGLEPRQLASDILRAAAQRRPMIIRPRHARILLVLSAISPRLGDYLLRRKSS
jgi:NAD(P)-dependent dehydrogenase (short-subunit alcohol dehydrogenase family)